MILKKVKETHLRKSREGCAELTLHQLLMKTLKMLSVMTRNAADHFALNPTATILHAANPMMDTKNRAMVHVPRIMNPMNRKISNTRPASRKLHSRKSPSVSIACIHDDIPADCS